MSFVSAVVSIYDAAPALIDDILTGSASFPSTGVGSDFNLVGPLSLAYVGNGIGFGLYTNSFVRTQTWGTYPQGSEIIDQYLLMIAGYAFRIPLPEAWNSTLDIGLSVPLFITARSISWVDARGLAASLITPLDIVATQPFWLMEGVGVEGGLLYSYKDLFSFGIAARNYGMTSVNKYSSFVAYLSGESVPTITIPMPMDISFGIRWSPPIHDLIRALDGLNILLDYNDAFDFVFYPAGATNPLLHIGVGVEVRLMKVISLRAGLFQALPSAGVSFDLTYFTLDFAVFGREATRQPGGDPVYGYLVGLTM